MSLLGVHAEDADGQKLPELINHGPGVYYPEPAKRRSAEGRVLIGFKISPAGRVVDQRIVKAEPKRLFEKTSMDELGSWTFAVPKDWNTQRELTITFIYVLAPCSGTAAVPPEPFPSDYKPLTKTGSRIGCRHP
jgi:TonB family protein